MTRSASSSSSEDRLEALSRTTRLLNLDVFDGTADEGAIASALGNTTIRIVSDKKNVSSVAGQTALTTLFAQTAMLGLQVILDIPDIALVSAQPPLDKASLLLGLCDYADDLLPGGALSSSEHASATIVLGDSRFKGTGYLRLASRDEHVVFGQPVRWTGDDPWLAMAAGALGAAIALRSCFGFLEELVGKPIPTRFSRAISIDGEIFLDHSPALISDMGAVDVISGGAITHSLIYALLRSKTEGKLNIIEPDFLELSHLNRYVLLRRSDLNREGNPKPSKAQHLTGYSNGDLAVEATALRFEMSRTSPNVAIGPVVVLGVDDIPTRWQAQEANPEWMGIGATSHGFGMVSTHSRRTPCARCVHPRDEAGPTILPTISFVSFLTGLELARSLLSRGTREPGEAKYLWPFSPEGRLVQRFQLQGHPQCPCGFARPALGPAVSQ